MTPQESYDAATAETERAYAVWVAAVGLGAIATARKAYFDAMERRRLYWRALQPPRKPLGPVVNDERRGI